MIESNRCKRCGNSLPKDGVLAGACPRCMLELGYKTESEIAEGKSAARLPESIGRYRVLRVIGEGGMGTVYEAEQDQPRRTVALKIVRHGITSPDLVRRFEQESQALGRLQHPGIAQIYEAGTVDTGFGPQPYFAMEFIRGLQPRVFAELHHLDTRQRIEIMVKICDAVHHAHQRGLIHRDLKPANILVDDAGQPKILDFGVVRVTDSDTRSTIETDIGQLIGTLAYMSPEQAMADPLELDTRTDVYALGIVFYELLTGRLPYSVGRKIHEAIQAIRDEDPAKISSINRAYRGDIETIVGKALEKDKTRRYQSAYGLAADLHRYLKDEPIGARPPSRSYQLRKFTRRHKTLVAGMAAVFVALVAGVLATTRYAIRANQQAERAGRAESDLLSRNKDLVAERQAALLINKQLINAEDTLQQEIVNSKWRSLHNLWESLARASALDSATRTDDDRSALLAIQAMRINVGLPNQAHILVEDALQKAVRLGRWTHNLLNGNETEVYSVAYSSDGEHLAAGGSDGLLRVWNIQQPGQPPLIYRGHQGPVLTVAFSADGKLIASGGGTDNKVRIWDLRDRDTPKAEFQFSQSSPVSLNPPRVQPMEGKVSYVAFSANGEYLAAAGADTYPRSTYTVRVWELHNPANQPLLLYRAPNGPGGSREPNAWVAFSHKGLRLASEGPDRVLRVWDLSKSAASPVLIQESGLPASIPPDAGSPNVGGFSAAFSPDDAFLASAAAGPRIWLWDLRNPNVVPRILQDNSIVKSVAFSPDGHYLASGGFGRQVRIWDLQKPGSYQDLRAHLAPVNAVAFSPDGTHVASGSTDKTLRVSEIRSTGAVPTIFSPSAPVDQPGPTNLISTGNGTPQLALNPGPTGPFRITIGAPVFKMSGAFSAGSARLAALGITRMILIWDLNHPSASPTQIQTTDVVQALAFSPDGVRLAAAGSDEHVRIWDLRKPDDPPVLVEVYADNLSSLAFSSDGFRLAVGCSFSNTHLDSVVDVRVWDLRYPSAPPVLLRGPEGNFTSITFSPDGSQIAASDGLPNNRLMIWDLRHPDLAPKLLWNTEPVTSVAFSPDGKRLAGGSSDGTLRVFEIRSLQKAPLLLQGPAGAIRAISFSSNGEQLAFASEVGGSMLFDLQSPGTPPILFDRAMTMSAAFLSDGTHLAASFATLTNGSVRMWPVWSTAADLLCTRVWRNLSMDEWRLYVGEGTPYERTCPALPPGAGAPGAPK